jgi:glutamate synthase domain-containing protein 1
MQNLSQHSNPYHDDKVIAACSLFGVMDTSGQRFSGSVAATAIANMHDRGNGLGGGFAAYGLYPDHADEYAFHVMFLSNEARREVKEFLGQHFHVHHHEPLPNRRAHGIVNPPQVWRYFVTLRDEHHNGHPEHFAEDYIVSRVMAINAGIADAFVFSSGRNMGVFKGVGFPEDIAEYFRLEEYDAYLWTAHGRFPTNTSGWWGGAHPFSILDWTVVHNGEISSYGINKRYLEMHGYQCTMHTDTEVVAYAADLLMRRHKLPVALAADVLAAPLWDEIDRMPPREQEIRSALRAVYGSLLLNGPFTVIIARQGEMIGLTDRIRLRPLTVATKGSLLFLSSEEAAIRLVCPDVERAWIPKGGEPIVGRLAGAALPQPQKTPVAAST